MSKKSPKGSLKKHGKFAALLDGFGVPK